MRPKAAATPTATTPDPYSRPKAISVAAAALEVEVAALAVPEAAAEVAVPLVAAAAEELLEVEEGAAAVKVEILRLPQFAFWFAVQTS